jgi:hypothetical protein
MERNFQNTFTYINKYEGYVIIIACNLVKIFIKVKYEEEEVLFSASNTIHASATKCWQER